MKTNKHFSRRLGETMYLYPSKAEIERKLQTMSISALAKELHIPRAALYSHVEVLHFNKPKDIHNKNVKYPPDAVLAKRLKNEKKSVIARELGITTAALDWHINARKIPNPLRIQRYSAAVRRKVIEKYVSGERPTDITKEFHLNSVQTVPNILKQSGAILTDRGVKYRHLHWELDTMQDVQKRMLDSRKLWVSIKEATQYPLIDFLIDSFDEAIQNAKYDIESKEKQLMMVRYGQKLDLPKEEEARGTRVNFSVFKNGSKVYTYQDVDVDGKKVFCCQSHGPKKLFSFKSPEDLLLHLAEHIAEGDTVPDSAITTLKGLIQEEAAVLVTPPPPIEQSKQDSQPPERPEITMTFEEQKKEPQFTVEKDIHGRIVMVCEHGYRHPVFAPRKMGSAGLAHGDCDGCCHTIPFVRFENSIDFSKYGVTKPKKKMEL